MEILAPAGNIESLKAAVGNSADAVYLGLDRFNARIKAENFTENNLSEWVDYCHLRGVKVYFTFNTLIKEEEIEDAIKYLKIAIKADVDAIILTDLSFIKIIRGICPDIKIHISTQCGICNLEGVKLIERLGADRVILARETPLAEIKRIISGSKIEVEIFCHGALCVSFSGQCLLSAYNNLKTGGASGNRGTCKQLCRQKYFSGLTKNEGYYLSPYDLCLIDKVKELEKAGVASLKIEGRLKKPEYVASAVKAYKNALQNKLTVQDADNMKLAFNRGYSTGYLYGNKNIINSKIQNHTGIRIGKVINCKKFGNLFEVTIKTDYPLEQGDGVKFIKEEELGGGEVSGKKNIVYTSSDIPAGADVHITTDISLKKLLGNEKRIDINMQVNARAGKRAELIVTGTHGKTAVKSDVVLEPAANITAAIEDNIRKNIGKVGNTCYKINELLINADKVFFPKSLINKLRRDGIESYNRLVLSGFKKTLNDYKPEINNSGKLMSAEEFYLFAKDKRYIEIPSILFNGDIEVLSKTIENYNTLDFLYINNWCGIILAERYDLPFVIGAGLSIYNSLFISQISNPSLCIKAVEAPELSGNFDCVPLMQFAHCPNLTDGGNCQTCPDMVKYSRRNEEYVLKKNKLANCYWSLYATEKEND